jgi:hypothetical protein
VPVALPQLVEVEVILAVMPEVGINLATYPSSVPLYPTAL